jgi:excinuclease ABC subunit C
LQAVEELQQALEMDTPPLRMECYDISNIQGTNSVGAMVVFENGAAKKSDYRKFKIKTVIGANDFASLQEMLRRRFKRYQDAKKMEQEKRDWRLETRDSNTPETNELTELNSNLQSPVSDSQSLISNSQSPVSEKKSKIPLSKGIRTAERKNDESWARMPDLVIIDGGKGQLHAAQEVFREMGIEGVKLISLAKREEEVFTPNRADSLRLPKHSAALHLLQRIRDEAHRFGITYHRSVRAKKGLHSQLDAIPGIGPRRRRALLQKFGSLDAIRDADIQELLQVEGMTKSAAQKLKESL